MDAITLLRNDHRDLEKLFKRYEKTGDGAHKSRRDIVDKVIEDLSIHSVIEEAVFYPAVRKHVPDAEGEVLEGLEEHHIMKWTLSELEDLDPAEERFHAKVTVLIETTRHHVKEEEQDLFPQVREVLKRKALTEIGDTMAEAKKTAPTRPHPRSPDTPPANLIAGPVAGLADKAFDAGKDAVDAARRALS